MPYAKLFAVWKNPMVVYGAMVVRRIDGREYECQTGKLYGWGSHYLILLSFCDSKARIVVVLCHRTLMEMSETLRIRLNYFKEKWRKRIAARRRPASS
jgi:hypothetical protein